jgi:sialate O-acetylesterase
MATTLYNAVLHPLAPYALSGVVWYQGESNTGNPAPYGDLLQKMIGNWRTLWHEPSLPFCVVQLANYDGRQQTGMPSPITPQSDPVNSNWARLREAQRMVAARDPYTELACIIDLGETVDIHPLRKKEVAERVALCFDRLVFGKKAPLFPQPVAVAGGSTGSADATAAGGKTASHSNGGGLCVAFSQPLRAGAVTGFEVAGADGRFVNAAAEARGSEVIIQSPVAAPVTVRYAWKDCPAATLYGENGLPATPFEVRQ